MIDSEESFSPPPPPDHHDQMEIEASDQGVPAQAITMALYIKVERSTRTSRFAEPLIFSQINATVRIWI